MYNDRKILAVIPARSGSKRLFNKNIKDLNGKPLIVWTIQAALKSAYIDKVIVSTDSEEIADISKRFGAEVPFIRPSNLSDDKTDSLSVIKHAVEFYNSQYDIVVLLQPTSPLRNTQDIDEAFKLLNNNTKAVVSVCKTDHSPLWSNTLSDDYCMQYFIKEDVKGKRSQDIPQYYRLNGSIYISFILDMINNNGFFGELTKAYIMPKERSVDIDDLFDFQFAEYLFKSVK
tara:strand:+ start:220 stop:909 length:690 start_codon:yes stop_codon:yes gene_type:complete